MDPKGGHGNNSVMYKKVKSFQKDPETGQFKEYSNWKRLIAENHMPEDNITDYVGVIDERIHNYKGITNRLNFGYANDKFNEIADDKW